MGGLSKRGGSRPNDLPDCLLVAVAAREQSLAKKAPRKASRKSKAKKAPDGGAEPLASTSEEAAGSSDEELVPEGHLVCALTGEHRTASPSEETLQSFIEQLHREYGAKSVGNALSGRDLTMVAEL
jgi:uncharacterized iron-regulated membrane protein